MSNSAALKREINIDIPDAYAFLLTEHHDFKGSYGGRDAARSWSFSQALLASGIMKKERILCAREIQKSIKDSVHQLMCDQIARLNMGFHYQCLAQEIRGYNGSSIIYEGLRTNVGETKSKEGITKAWIEEANKVSKTSWNTLIPTIRQEGAEIWLSFNPELESDYTYQNFVINPPPMSKIIYTTWRDNPWFSDFSRRQMEHLKATDFDEYLVVWEGKPRNSLQNAVYAEELRKAELEDRIRKVAYNASYPVNTYWDLGFGDHTSIWFAQKIGWDWAVIRFFQNNQKFVPFYVQQMQSFGYVYGTHFLPHDGSSNHLAGESIKAQLEKAMPSVEVIVLPRLDPIAGINAARTVFPNCHFDRELCSEGLQMLRHYVWKTNDQGVVTRREPLHDENSDGADAFRTFAMSRNHRVLTQGKKGRSGSRAQRSSQEGGSNSWMGA